MGEPVVEKKIWQEDLRFGIQGMLSRYAPSSLHTDNTPQRVLSSYAEMFNGVDVAAEDVLKTIFPSNADEMVHVSEISFFSTCSHHLLPFFGKAWFAYIPSGQVVGLSKIPRLVDMYARRPQVQEELTEQIVDAFQRIVRPKGCGVHLRGHHLCAMARGIKQSTSFMQTTALRGNFKLPDVKQEFLQATLHELER